MKRVLTVQDLSCVGRCSLTVALPVLSAMGIQAAALPTAVLSTHTAFPDPEVVSLTDSLVPFANHWKNRGIGFDAISLGYLSDPRQAEAALEIAESFDCPLILDPVMGDGGRLYSRITREHIAAMQRLCAKAEVALPNVTEAAFLTGSQYRAEPDEDYLSGLAGKLLKLGVKNVVITGIRWSENAIGWYYRGEKGSCKGAYDYVPRNFHGTGDLFAAVFCGSYVNHKDIPTAAEKAAEFVRRCVAATEESTPFGVEFEKELAYLCN